ncbi:MAG: hypothetical protein QOK21_2817 [Solirubrobacteraceae bacterium]|jgi:glycosyltransferase involved in cell wall biosynthesis|nr:hypothetical protein [Solirubrobacteraceae bacterium]
MSVPVSLIMPAWEPRSDWLREAVASALREDCDVELVVVDDGSATPVESLLAPDPRVRVIRTAHVGPYAARNVGLAAARGTHVRFLDADDVVEAGSTTRLFAAVGDDEAIAYGATLMCDEALNPVSTIASTLEGDVAPATVLGRFDVRVVSLLFPRAVLERAGPWDPSFPVSGDWDYVLRAVELAPVRRVDAVVTRYRRHGDSVTRTADVAAGGRAGRMVLAGYFARHPEQRGTALQRRAYLRLHLDRAGAHRARREWRAAARELRAAARRDPLATARWLSARAARRAARGRRTRAGTRERGRGDRAAGPRP